MNTQFQNMANEALSQYVNRAGANLRGSLPRPSKGKFSEQIPKGYKAGSLRQFDQPQMDLYKRMFGAVSPDSYLSRLSQGDEELYNEIEAPALRQFSGLQGNIASRFSQGGGQGSLSARRSSGFQNEMSSAASNFAQELQARRQGMQTNAIQEMQRLSHALLSERPYERGLFGKQQKAEGGGWGGPIGAGLGAATGFFAGGPMGALTGANVGYNVGNAF